MIIKTIEDYKEDLSLANARIDKALEYIEENVDECSEVMEHVSNILLHWIPNVPWVDVLDCEELEG